MYDLVDRPVTTLDAGGRFLVWAMRSWVKTGSDGGCSASAIAPAFAKWRMIGGLQPFHRAMLILSGGALETIRFCALSCNHVSEHEAILIGLVRSLGGGQAVAAHDTVALMVEEDRVSDCFDAFAGLAAAMGHAEILPGIPASA